MKRWEYKSLETSSLSEFEAALQRLGWQRWEVIWMDPDRRWAFFKREVERRAGTTEEAPTLDERPAGK